MQRAGNPVGCTGKAETTPYTCFCAGILSWTTKPHHQEPLSDQSKEGHGCPGMGMARLGLAGVSWQQGWGRDFLGPLPQKCAFSDLGISSARSNFHPLQFPRGLVRQGKKCCQRFSPSLPKCKPPGSPAGIWQPQKCAGIQETSGQGLGMYFVKRNISLRTSLHHTHS